MILLSLKRNQVVTRLETSLRRSESAKSYCFIDKINHIELIEFIPEEADLGAVIYVLVLHLQKA